MPVHIKFNPLSLLARFGTKGYELYLFFTKGARIDASLRQTGSTRSPTPHAIVKPGAKPTEEGGDTYVSGDLLTRWKLEITAELLIKNNSKNNAYNLQLLNASDVFTEYQPLPRLTSLQPHESIPTQVKFVKWVMVENGNAAGEEMRLMLDNWISPLIIQYENESGRLFYTKFHISLAEVKNERTNKL